MKFKCSKAQHRFLVLSGIDLNNPDAVAAAKKEYRKQYKKNWKTQTRKPREVRPTFSEYEYQELCLRARLLGLQPTTYVRQLVLSNQENTELIPNKPQLLELLQLISIAARKEPSNTHLISAEALLLSYLNNH